MEKPLINLIKHTLVAISDHNSNMHLSNMAAWNMFFVAFYQLALIVTEALYSMMCDNQIMF